MALFRLGGGAAAFSSSGIEMKLKGDKDAIRKLWRMKNSLQRRLTRKAADSAMRVARKKARSAAPIETGELRRQMDIRTKAYPKSGVVVSVVGPKRGRTAAAESRLTRQAAEFGPARSRRGQAALERRRSNASKALKRVPANYFHLVELGTRRGVKATHFLERALTRNRSAILGKFRSTLRRGILREAARK